MSECRHYLTTSLADYEHKRVSCKWCIKCGKSDGEIDLQAQVERLEAEVKHLKHVCPDCGYAGTNLHKLPDFHCTQCGFEQEQAKDDGGSDE